MSVPRHFALIPAAGVGSRLGAATPKQYLELAGKPMLLHAIDAFLRTPQVQEVFVVVAPDDPYIDAAIGKGDDPRLRILRCGGDSRRESVLNGLNAICEQTADVDWVLVHDAARPGLTPDLIQSLMSTLQEDPVGGLLALPVVDTLKRDDGNGRACETVPRSGLWSAQTPQMFRYGLLKSALAHADGVTDEAAAVESMGMQPRLVEGAHRNFKVTLPQDIELAEFFLKNYP
jgi:2-C-methyl-D-erythritol 4-phosphate cytidylyltransferase